MLGFFSIGNAFCPRERMIVCPVTPCAKSSLFPNDQDNQLSSLMNLTSSQPFWSVNNGLQANYPSLQRNVSCDVVVIGGGITGALVAIHLAEAGVKTLVLDQRDIGTGSTSASTALLQYEIDVPLRELIKQVGPAAATRSYRLCREAIGKLQRLATRLKIDCGFERKPSLFLARHQREIPELREEFRLRRKMGIELEFYDAPAIQARFPFSRPAALFSNGSSWMRHRNFGCKMLIYRVLASNR